MLCDLREDPDYAPMLRYFQSKYGSHIVGYYIDSTVVCLVDVKGHETNSITSDDFLNLWRKIYKDKGENRDCEKRTIIRRQKK